MACSSGTAPIDIVNSQSTTCNKKCDYAFDYEKNTPAFTSYNKGNYIKLVFNPDTNSPVIFNNEKYNLIDVCIFSPSLHTYNGEQSDGEILINHSSISTSSNLIVSIPINKSSTGNNNLQKIITETSSLANSDNTSGKIDIPAFSLNNFIPQSPYYFYNGTKMYDNCKGNYNYIVFDQNSSIPITFDVLKVLKNIIQPYKIKTKNNKLFYNKNGPSMTLQGTNGDDIYIKCEPTGDNGSTMVEKSNPYSLEDFGNINFKNFTKSPIFKIIIGIIIALLLTSIIAFVSRIVFSNSSLREKIPFIGNQQK